MKKTQTGAEPTAAAMAFDPTFGQGDDSLANAHLKVAPAKATKGALSRMVEWLVFDGTLSYRKIVEQVKAEFPDATTSTRSVASVACVMRSKGHAVPKRVVC